MPFIPLLSSTFPEPRPGPYATGYAVVRLPASPAYAAPTPHLLKNGAPALALTETVMAIYYPTAPKRGRGHAQVRWMPGPIASVVEGYAKFYPVVAGWKGAVAARLFGRFRMPVHPAAPLAEPKAGTKFPLVLFSHGLVGTRNTYSQFCSALASEGYVVVAVEHADGTSPCVVRGGKPFVFTKIAETTWEDGPDTMDKMMAWRAHQLDFRVREVYDAYAGFQRFVAGEVSLEYDGDVTGPIAAALREKVDVSALQLIGHSFGGATALRLLQTSPPEPFSSLPIQRAVLLDPWMEPIEAALPSTPSPTTPPPPLVINSQGWLEGDYFPGGLETTRAMGGTLCSIYGLGHSGFSDFGLLTPKRGAREMLATVHALTIGHLRDAPSSLLDKPPQGGPTVPHAAPHSGAEGDIEGEVATKGHLAVMTHQPHPGHKLGEVLVHIKPQAINIDSNRQSQPAEAA